MDAELRQQLDDTLAEYPNGPYELQRTTIPAEWSQYQHVGIWKGDELTALIGIVQPDNSAMLPIQRQAVLYMAAPDMMRFVFEAMMTARHVLPADLVQQGLDIINHFAHPELYNGDTE